MMEAGRVILLIEDSEEDFQTAKRLLGKLTDRKVERCGDAPSAYAYLHRILEKIKDTPHIWPDVILLDLNMPGEDGRGVLTRLKGDERFRRIPVVILTTSANPKDLEYCYSHGAAGYIVKPVDLAKFRVALEHLTNYWLRAVLLPPGEAVS